MSEENEPAKVEEIGPIPVTPVHEASAAVTPDKEDAPEWANKLLEEVAHIGDILTGLAPKDEPDSAHGGEGSPLEPEQDRSPVKRPWTHYGKR